MDCYLQGNHANWWWGIASEVESTNNLLNLLKLAVTTLDSSKPTLLPTTNDSSIADSVLLGFYFGPNATVNNYDATVPTIEVQIATGTPVQSVTSAKLALVPNLPASSQGGLVMAGSPHSLISFALFVDAGCQAIFTKTLVVGLMWMTKLY